MKLLTKIAWTAATIGSLAMMASASPPNIVLIVLDDIGWKDVGYNDSPVCETTNLDRLAAEGMHFTQAYAPAPICSASRAAILTGQSPARLGLEFVTKFEDSPLTTNNFPLQPPPITLNLPLEAQTIPEVLKSAGFKSGFFGKWHVSAHKGVYLGWSDTHGPRQQGFDEAEEDFGGHSYNGMPDEKRRQIAKSYAPGEYPADSMTDRAIAFIDRNAHGAPFFLEVCHFYAHTPIVNQADWLTKKYAKKLPEGAGAERAEYAAFVEIMDHHVGRLLAALRRNGIEKRTLVVVISDNGGDPRYTQHSPLRGHKWTLYEGGIRVPMIVRWPGMVRPGSVCKEPVIGTDLLPTFAEVAHAALSADTPLDGMSLVPLLRGNLDRTFAERELVWHFPYYHPEKRERNADREVRTNARSVPFIEPHSALRRGDLKVIKFYESQSVELYDLSSDLGEQHELSSTTPQLADQMAADLESALESVHARFPTRRGATVEKSHDHSTIEPVTP